MKRELLSKAVGEIDESFVAEAYRDIPGDASGSPERKRNVKVKRIITLALAAVLVLSLGGMAYAVKTNISTPQAAQRVALQELEVWKEMGLISPEISFEGEPNQIVEIEEETGSDYWYGRFFPHSYDVRWFLGPIDWGEETPPPELVRRKFGCNLRVDTLSGKITQAFIDARSDEDDEPIRSVTLDRDPRDDGRDTRDYPWTLYFYDNFTDIFPGDMTVDHFCTLLAEYWGFTGYKLEDTVDETYIEAPWECVEGDSLLKDMPSDGNYYLTVFFEGDQKGTPRYVQLNQFPGYVQLNFGMGHAVG